jgi:bifunctional non-homologous end joining protein LigD
MPATIVPMKAALAERPPKDPGWLFEVKWDGVRAICFIQNETIRIVSRNGLPIERQYPELSVVPHYVDAGTAILDAEIATLDERGISRFQLLQPRITNSDPNSVSHLAHNRPVTLFAFDLLYLDGYDLRRVALAERKRALESILRPCPVMRYSDHFEDNGEQMLAAAKETGLEGIMAKRANSCYEPRRSSEWLKLKITAEQDFVICGLTAGEREYFGSLALGAYDHGKLTYVGNVGTGFDQKLMAAIYQKLEPLITSKSPFTPAPRMLHKPTWVKPELVCEVKFANWTEDGRLRAPVFQGLRPDVEPRECVRDEAEEMPPEEIELPAGASPAAPGPAVNRTPLLPPKVDEVITNIDGRQLKFTHLNKVFYPRDGCTKRDVLNYYDAVSGLILPHIKDRPLSLKRYPNGIHEEYFFQKNTPQTYPAWMRYEMIPSEHAGKPIRYVLADDRASLLYLVNLGCIDQNPWMSRVGSLGNPDFLLIDLDPHGCEFDKIVEAALLVRKTLDALGLAGYPKTTGGDGLHIYLPLVPEYSYDQVRSFAELIANLVIAERPKLFTTPRAVAKREAGKVYFDYLQISESKTIAAPYVLRAYDGAPVATPLAWDEVKPGLTPEQFNIGNVLDRFDKLGDLFRPVLDQPQRLEESLAKMEDLVRGGA